MTLYNKNPPTCRECGHRGWLPKLGGWICQKCRTFVDDQAHERMQLDEINSLTPVPISLECEINDLGY